MSVPEGHSGPKRELAPRVTVSDDALARLNSSKRRVGVCYLLSTDLAVRCCVPSRADHVHVRSALCAIKAYPMHSLNAPTVTLNVKRSCASSTGVFCQSDRRGERGTEGNSYAREGNTAAHMVFLINWVGAPRYLKGGARGCQESTRVT